MIVAGVWLFLVAALILTVHAVGRHQSRRTAKTHVPVALHVPTETPADAEWRRRLARWTKEAEDAS